MRVPAPRLGQLTHLFSLKPTAAFGYKNMLASIRRHRDPLASRTILPLSTSTSSDVEPKCNRDVETVPDDRTLVESRRCSSHSDEADSISLSDVPEDEECPKSRRTSRGPSTSSETPEGSVRLSIVFPLPSAENLLAYDPTPPAIDSSVAPPLCVHPLTPPPTHYKRRRARIISNEDYDPDPDQAPIRFNSKPEGTLRFPF